MTKSTEIGLAKMCRWARILFSQEILTKSLFEYKIFSLCDLLLTHEMWLEKFHLQYLSEILFAVLVVVTLKSPSY